MAGVHNEHHSNILPQDQHATDGYDAVVLSPHKYVGGPGTPGLLCINKKLYKLKDHAPSTTALYLEDLESREDAETTPSILQRIKIGMVSTVQEEMGYRLIESREHSLITTALKRSENKKIVLGSTQVKRAAIVSFLVRTTDSKDELQLQARYSLLKVSDDLSLKFRAAIQERCQTWMDALELRILPLQERVPFLAVHHRIEFVADYGQRFLPLYEFDRTREWAKIPLLQEYKEYLGTATAIAKQLRPGGALYSFRNHRLFSIPLS
ncbi:hypothetical protein SELMODRAFT_419492 [Selaginella moellendorffii]|uniref:Uncharacterized protein n=1 Tax=Selaginella moellendorffii TaxID=88036 RepID=D8S944_SELML|nr:hypothetical protein SELMODRAFT_419492 [Selaginella moellendorffii]